MSTPAAVIDKSTAATATVISIVPTTADSLAAAPQNIKNVRTKDEASLAPFNPSCDQAQLTALQLLKLRPEQEDVLFDLGCGDGRMLINAAQKHPDLRCVGIELDPVFVKRGQEALRKLPRSIQRRVDIRQGNLMMQQQEMTMNGNHPTRNASNDTGTISNITDSHHNNGNNSNNDEGNSVTALGEDCRHLSLLEDATAIYLFLLPKGIQKIQGLLDAIVEKRKQEKKSFRVVAYMFSIREWEPVLVDRSTKGEAPLYLYQFLPETTT